MKTLEQFKKELGIERIQMLKSEKGREFAKIGDITIVVSHKYDGAKPAFVVVVEKDKDGNKLDNVYAICNSTLTEGRAF